MAGGQDTGETVAAHVFAGGGEMGAHMRAMDWSRTPLGSPSRWPQSLRTAVSILLNSRYPMFVFWGKDLVKIYNDGYRPITGAKHPWAMGRPGPEVWPEIWDTIGPMVQRVVEHGEATWSDDLMLFMERNGFPEEVYFTFSYSPIRDESGGIGGLFCACTETTDKVLSERRLSTLHHLAAGPSHARTVEEACRAASSVLEDNAADIPFSLLYLLDDDGVLRLAGCTGTAPDAPISPVRITPDDASGFPFAAVIASRRPEIVRSLASRFSDLPTGPWPEPPHQAWVLPLVARDDDRPAGVIVLGVGSRRTFDDKYRDFVALVAGQITTSIANARASEQERRRAEALAEIDRAKTLFFSNVSHEFRTPLTLMLGPLEDALARADGLALEQREGLELAYRNARRLAKLVNMLLDFSRIEAGRIMASYEPVDLGSLTAELASLFRSTIERAGIELVIDCPQSDEPTYVDREMWEKIVFNLLSNAFKFTFAGKIEVRTRHDDAGFSLCVRDTGTGIAEAELPRLFERFHRIKGARGRTFEGSGIGLALVYELVKLHGGAVRVESEVDRGSAFTVTLPRGRAHLPADRINADAGGSSVGPTGETYLQELLGWLPGPAADATQEPISASARRDDARPRARIVLADDNADMRAYVRRLLSPAYDVEAVADGVAALQAVRRRAPDLVLADVMMPEMDGLGLLRAIRDDASLPRIPVILLSARAGEQARLDGLSAGADDYLAKPFSARELLARVSARLEMHRLQQRLDEERLALHGFFAQTPVPTAILRGPDLTFEIVNPAYIAVVGGRDVVDKPLSTALPELADQGYGERLRAVMRSGVPSVESEAKVLIDRGGGTLEETYFTFLYAPLRTSSGEIDGVIAICNDVTDQVHAREAILQSEARYRHIFETARVSIWEEDFSAVKTAMDDLVRSPVTDVRGYLAEHPEFVREAIAKVNVVDANEASVRMFGARDRQQLLGSLGKIFAQETDAVFMEELIAIAEGRAFVEGEAILRRLNGDRLAALVTVAFPPTDPQLRRVLVTVVDITDRKDAEQALREEAARLEVLNRIGRTLAAELELERIAQAVTDAATEVSGAAWGAFSYAVAAEDGDTAFLHTVGGAAAETFESLAAPDKTALLAALQDRGIVRCDDVLAATRDGRPAIALGVPAEAVRSYLAVPVVSRSGELIGGLFFGHPEPGVFSERTERIVDGIASHAAIAFESARLHEQRLQLIERLREADRRKDDFLAMLGHELRNPLAAIRSATELVKLAEPDDARVQRAHDVLDRQANHVARLVDGLLEVSRITRGKIELEPRPLDLRTVIGRVLQDHWEQFARSGITLQTEIDDAPLWVCGDDVRLVQVFDNLVSNAIKFTRRSGTIRVVAHPQDTVAIVRISDDGVGITPALLPRIFEPFQQETQDSARASGGLGLGLALVKGLVELHGGDVDARSEGSGTGAEFRVRLPLTTAVAPVDDPSPPPPTAGARVLIVEDNLDAAQMLADLLAMSGHDVAVVHSGFDVVDNLRARRADVVLCDLGLPGMSGYDVARAVRAQPALRDVTLVALTGYGQPDDRKRTRDAGFDEHLIKPVDLGTLSDLLSRFARDVAR